MALLDEKQRSTFDIFVPFFTPLDALTNSALMRSVSVIFGTVSKTNFCNINPLFVTTSGCGPGLLADQQLKSEYSQLHSQLYSSLHSAELVCSIIATQHMHTPGE